MKYCISFCCALFYCVLSLLPPKSFDSFTIILRSGFTVTWIIVFVYQNMCNDPQRYGWNHNQNTRGLLTGKCEARLTIVLQYSHMCLCWAPGNKNMQIWYNHLVKLYISVVALRTKNILQIQRIETLFYFIGYTNEERYSFFGCSRPITRNWYSYIRPRRIRLHYFISVLSWMSHCPASCNFLEIKLQLLHQLLGIYYISVSITGLVF